MPRDPRLEEKYEDSEELSSLAKTILSAHDEDLKDAELFSFRIIFTKRHFKHYAGVVKRLGDAFRYLFNTDYIILVNEEEYNDAAFEKKAFIVIHELHHIMDGRKAAQIMAKVAPYPKLRRHQGNYCELPEHDTFSKDIYERIKAKLEWKPVVEVEDLNAEEPKDKAVEEQ